MSDLEIVRSITGSQTTAGASEETLNISLDGATPAASIAVPVSSSLTISDWIVTAEAAARFRFQQTNNGSTWFDIFLLRVAVDGTVGVSNLGVGLVVTGGATVAVRVRVATPAGAAPVTTSIRSYTNQ